MDLAPWRGPVDGVMEDGVEGRLLYHTVNGDDGEYVACGQLLEPIWQRPAAVVRLRTLPIF
jgi:hypothetical protein